MHHLTPSPVLEEPITEQSNVLSSNIDAASATEIAAILYACDLEIFHGWRGSTGVHDGHLHDKMAKVAEKISEVIQKPGGSVIFSGCGTSGRLAFLTARTFNRYLKSLGRPECFQYLIAGGDRALFKSMELAEDDPIVGAHVLKEATRDKTQVVFVGISCGMSAPFVAGQLDYCMNRLDVFTPVLIGFNYTHQARNTVIEKWDKTFLQVVQEMEKAEKLWQAFILNPIIGPEPITGSSRMKSGTTTRILLDILSVVAVHGFPQCMIGELVSLYEAACHSVYKHREQLGSLIQLAASCLIKGGHVYYLGANGTGLTAMIDASECPPTFGASFNDIRGFVDGGFSQLDNNEGDLSNLGPDYKLSLADFAKDIQPDLRANDLVVFLDQDQFHKQWETFMMPCRRVLVTCGDRQVSTEEPACDLVINISLDLPLLKTCTPEHVKKLVYQLATEMCIKWLVNCLSTGAHVLKGKVYQNKMVDVRVSNSKLFHRAAAIIQKYCGLSVEEATEYLLRSIYRTDSLTVDQRSSPVVNNIIVASQQDKVVPTAMLMASLRCSVQEAESMLGREPIISKLLRTPGTGL
ncbi:hypothetical protein BsWGS_19964 [Bradybaena similaris]